jgi:hypothetical protein
MISDLRFAWRALWKSPTTTLGAMLALALGIGATTTMFGLLNAVLRPLPYPNRIASWLWGKRQRKSLNAAACRSRLPGLRREEPPFQDRRVGEPQFHPLWNGAPSSLARKPFRRLLHYPRRQRHRRPHAVCD